MKKFILLSILLAGFVIARSQTLNVQSAYNFMNKGKWEKAKEAIDPAIQDSKTSDLAKTWYYRGNIYLNIHLSKDPKIKSLDTNALEIAFESFQKAQQLDKDKEYKKQISDEFFVCGEQFYNKGVEYYNKKLFDKSLIFFTKTVDINAIYGKIDTLATFYSAVSADLGNKPDIARKNYIKLYDLNYKKLPLYIALQKNYKKEKDTAKALEVIQKGLKLFPDNLSLIIEETNIYLAKGQTDKAQKNLMKAVEKDPKNPNLYFAIGTNYDKIYNDTSKTIQERMNAFAQSEISYKKSIEFKPDYFDPNYNLGALYYNESVRIIENADKIQDDKKFQDEKVKYEALWKKALPYLEKAYQIQPNDPNTLISLKAIYSRTSQKEKYDEVTKKLNEIKPKK